MALSQRRPLSTRDVVLCGLFAALIAVGAFIRITLPTEPYPFTFSLQWLFVLLAGFLLGAKLGTMSVATYLIIGLVGVPVFVHGGGPQYIFRAGFGFLLGFLAAAFVIGLIANRLTPASGGAPGKFLPELAKLLVAAFAGLVVYYVIGIAYYYFMYTCVLTTPAEWGLGIAIAGCMTTFLPDAVLCVVAAALSIRLRPALHAMGK
ncbi:MAG: biotin transporter BioY [Clostridia bacterium]|nr:biotin transporter BioY [Clostridia bacterium]